LQAISQYLQKNVREVESIARYGGEEFLILITDADERAAFFIAERLRKNLSKIELFQH
jgi:diguanylate cyclase (GGDEF)-like protein